MYRGTLIFIILLIIPISSCFSQLLGVGVQYADAKSKGNDFQFAVNASYPIWTKKNPLNIYISSGIDYTGGSSPVAGLNLKPIQLTSYITESMFNNHKITFMAGCDIGYLFNFNHGKDGLIVSPNVSLDYSIFFLKTGYDFNVTGNKRQFFARIGVGMSIGTLKSFVKTRIR